MKDIIATAQAWVQTLRNKNNEGDDYDDDEDDDEDDVDVCIKVREQKEADENNNDNDDGFSIAAFIQIVTLFFQVASLLQETFQGSGSGGVGGTQNDDDDRSDRFSRYRETLADIFNFRFTLIQGICPSDDLTLPQKEIILFAMKMCTFVVLLLLALSSQLMSRIKKRLTSASTKKKDDVNIELGGAALDEKDQVDGEYVMDENQVDKVEGIHTVHMMCFFNFK